MCCFAENSLIIPILWGLHQYYLMKRIWGNCSSSSSDKYRKIYFSEGAHWSDGPSSSRARKILKFLRECSCSPDRGFDVLTRGCCGIHISVQLVFLQSSLPLSSSLWNPFRGRRPMQVSKEAISWNFEPVKSWYLTQPINLCKYAQWQITSYCWSQSQKIPASLSLFINQKKKLKTLLWYDFFLPDLGRNISGFGLSLQNRTTEPL